MLARAFAIAAICAPTFFAFAAKGQSETNIVTCVLERAGSDFKGTCEVPCSVNALAIDIDGPNPKKACDSPSRRVAATLRETNGNWLGTMQGKFPEDPTRFEVVMHSAAKSGVAKTPFGWFYLQSARREHDTLSLTIAANNQLPPTFDDIRIIQRAEALLSDQKTLEQRGQPDLPSKPEKVEFVLRAPASDRRNFRRSSLSATCPSDGERSPQRGRRCSFRKHRLMDYNNHPDTTLADIHDLLHIAQTRLEQRLR
jgi:hypothetical protein